MIWMTATLSDVSAGDRADEKGGRSGEGRGEETIRSEQQQIQEMRQRVSLVCGVVCCD